MDTAIYENRREKLRGLMHKAGLSALLICLDANRFYLSGFELQDPQANESSGRLLIMADGKDWLCTDSRFYTAARRLWDEDRIFIYKGGAMEQINGLLKDKVLGTVGFEAQNISFDAYEKVSSGLSMQRADGMVEALRMIKDPEEIRRLEKACVLNHKLMEWIPGALVPGRTEAQVAWDVEQFFRNHGAQGLSFSSIVAVGPNAALPHAEPGQDRISENCGVLVDVGCRLNEYCSDQTRTFWVGARPTPEFSTHLKYIKEAQARAIKAIRPGAATSAVYAAAASYLEEKGVLNLFTHGLGHGIGLQTHEAPSLNPSSDAVLKAGVVVTVEPGLYLPNHGGVRWEYMVLVTEDGARVL